MEGAEDQDDEEEEGEGKVGGAPTRKTLRDIGRSTALLRTVIRETSWRRSAPPPTDELQALSAALTHARKGVVRAAAAAAARCSCSCRVSGALWEER